MTLDLAVLLGSWQIHLQAERKSPQAVDTDNLKIARPCGTVLMPCDPPAEGDVMLTGASILAVFLWILGSLLSLWIFYWIVRLAVRHGIEDAWRRRPQRAREESGWDPARQ